MLRILTLLLLALTLTSCYQPKPIEVIFVNYQIVGATGDGINVNFQFEVNNPNSLAINVADYAYKVFINENELLSESRKGFNLQPKEKAAITIPVTIRYDRLLSTALSVLGGMQRGATSFNYRVEGYANAGTTAIAVKVPFNASGTILFPK